MPNNRRCAQEKNPDALAGTSGISSHEVGINPTAPRLWISLKSMIEIK
jgi:hypothetical protein